MRTSRYVVAATLVAALGCSSGPPSKPATKPHRSPESDTLLESETTAPPADPEAERRVRALEAQLQQDLAADAHAAPPARVRLDRPATPGEVGAQLEAALRLVPEALPATAGIELGLERPAGAFLPHPLRSGPGSQKFREALAPAVAAVRAALACERLSPVYDHARWLHAGSRYDGRALRLVASALAAEALAALDSGHGVEAGRLAGELWQLAFDVARAGPVTELLAGALVVGVEADALTTTIVPRLDADGLAALDADLLRLDDAPPSFASALHSERLEVGLAYRECVHGRGAGRLGLPLGAPRGAERPPLGLPELGADWSAVDALLREREAAVTPLPSPVTAKKIVLEDGTPRARWSDFVDEAYAHWARFVVQVRFDHAWIAFWRFHAARGHFPGTLEEALGRAPGPHERDPGSGKPFVLRPLGVATFQLENVDSSDYGSGGSGHLVIGGDDVSLDAYGAGWDHPVPNDAER